jgi:hypothetical protein
LQDGQLKEFLLNQSLAVRTFTLPDVKNSIEGLIPTYDSVQHYKTSIIDWLKPVVDLSGFSVYPMNGITEGLNWWYNRETRGVQMNTGDYQWIETKSSSSYMFYQSVPSAIDGNFADVRTDVPVALDLAYVGSTRVKPIEISNNVEYAFYSLSKSFGIGNIRTGWYFSRNPDSKLESLIYSAKYYNYFAHNIAETIISKFDIDYVYNTLTDKQKRVCDALGFTPSDSVWLACTTQDEYKKFRRYKDVARICLAGVYK